MKTWWPWAIGAVLALTACGRSGSGSTNGGVGATPGDHGTPDGDKGKPVDDHPSAKPCDHVAIRVTGTSPGDVTELALVVEGLEATMGGARLPLHDAQLGTPLSILGNGPTIGVFDLPGDLGDLALRLWLGGGKAHKGTREGDLDRCTGPLSFRLERWHLVPGVCELQVEVNLERSVAMDGDGLAFVPHVRAF